LGGQQERQPDFRNSPKNKAKCWKPVVSVVQCEIGERTPKVFLEILSRFPQVDQSVVDFNSNGTTEDTEFTKKMGEVSASHTLYESLRDLSHLRGSKSF